MLTINCSLLLFDASVTISFAFMGKFLLALLIIYVLTELTPKIAAKIDSSREKSEKKKPSEDERLYSVKSAFEPHDDDEVPDKTFFPELKKNNKSANKSNRNED